MSSHGLCPNILKPMRVTAGSKPLIAQILCNTSVSTCSSVILSDTCDHFPIFAQVKGLGNFSGNDDSYVTIECRMKNSERDSMFRSILKHIQYDVYYGIDNVDMLCGTLISDFATATLLCLSHHF